MAGQVQMVYIIAASIQRAERIMEKIGITSANNYGALRNPFEPTVPTGRPAQPGPATGKARLN